MKKIAVIGAGCSGLTAIKSCLDEGLLPVCYERESDIGGLWNYSEEPNGSKGSVYRSCVINISKEMMAFSDFPVPKEAPPFMHHTEVLKYFHLYAAKFDLLKYIQFRSSVEHIRPADDYAVSGRWCITTKRLDDAGEGTHEEEFDGVMVCSGHHAAPHIPNFEGLDKFRGVKLHSHDYKRPDVFQDKKVLIIGMGNSAVDIAVDLSSWGEKIYLSSRRGAWVVSRLGPFGFPADAMANSRVMFSLPRWLLQWSVEKMANYKFNHQRLGLNPVHRALEAFPTINEDIHLRIMNGAIRVRPNVKCFTENGVMFDDNTFESIDVVILATGYDYKYRFLSSTVLNTENNNIELYKYVFPPQLPHPTLAMIGLVQAVGAVMPISELQSRWFTRIVKGHLTLPSKEIMMEDIAQRKKNVRQTFLPSQRHALQTFWVPYMDELADAVGCKPNLKKMFFRDPMFALWCYFGPCVPAQFRLEGPGKWEGARSAVKNCYVNMFGATERSAPPAGESSIWNRLSNRSTCVRENVRRFRKSVAVNHNHGPGYYMYVAFIICILLHIFL